MAKLDWILVAVWVAFLVFLGPWLISAPSWIAVGLGFGLLIALMIVTVNRVKGYLLNE